MESILDGMERDGRWLLIKQHERLDDEAKLAWLFVYRKNGCKPGEIELSNAELDEMEMAVALALPILRAERQDPFKRDRSRKRPR